MFYYGRVCQELRARLRQYDVHQRLIVDVVGGTKTEQIPMLITGGLVRQMGVGGENRHIDVGGARGDTPRGQYRALTS